MESPRSVESSPPQLDQAGLLLRLSNIESKLEAQTELLNKVYNLVLTNSTDLPHDDSFRVSPTQAAGHRSTPQRPARSHLPRSTTPTPRSRPGFSPSGTSSYRPTPRKDRSVRRGPDSVTRSHAGPRASSRISTGTGSVDSAMSRGSNFNRTFANKRNFRAPPTRERPDFSLVGVAKGTKGVEDTAPDGISYKPLQGLVFPPSDPQPLVSNQPKQELELEYVHGYQGQGTRHNIFLIGSGEIAYFVGRLGIVLSVERNEQRFFKEHQADVKCMAVHEAQQLAVTSEVATEGKPSKAFVWSTRSCELTCELKGLHSKDVVAVAFSGCGTAILTLGSERRHALGLWSATTGKLLGAAADLVLETGGPLLDIATPKSIPSDHMTICELWEHAQSGDPSSEAERRTTSSAHAVVVGKNAVLFLTFAPIAEEERNAMSAQADGVPPGLDVWIVDGKLKEGYHPQAETQTYFSAACLKHGQVVVGCQDGSIHVYQDSNMVRAVPGHTAPVYGMCTSPMGLITVGKDGRLLRWSDSLTPTVCLHLGPHMLSAVDSNDGTDVVVGSRGNSILHVNLLHAIQSDVALTPKSDSWTTWQNAIERHHHLFGRFLRERATSRSKVLMPALPGIRGSRVVAPPSPRLRMKNEEITYWQGWPQLGHDGSVRGKTEEELLGCRLTLGRALSGEWAAVHWAGSVTVMAQGASESIWGVAAHPHLDIYATTSDDGVLRLWSAGRAGLLAQLTLPRRSRCLAFHPNGNILAVGLEAPTESGDAPMAFHPPGKKSNLPISIGDDNVEAKGGGFLLVTVKGVENDLTINTLGAKRGDGGGGEEAMTPSGEEKEIEEDLTSDIDFRVVQRRCQAHRMEAVHCISFSPDGSALAVAYGDANVDVYAVSLVKDSAPTRSRSGSSLGLDDLKRSSDTKKGAAPGGMDILRKKVLHSYLSPVVNMDWDVDSRYLATVTASYELLLWEPLAGKQIRSPSLLRDTVWTTQTCILGWAVRGIWKDEGESEEVNAVCRNRTGLELLATTDEDGSVKLFQYPAHLPKAEHKQYKGHSANVTNITFLADDGRIISVGGEDNSVFQWRVMWQPKEMSDDDWYKKARITARPKSRRTTVFFREMKKAKEAMESEQKANTPVSVQIEQSQKNVAAMQRSHRVNTLLKKQMSAFASPTARRGRGRGKAGAGSGRGGEEGGGNESPVEEQGTPAEETGTEKEKEKEVSEVVEDEGDEDTDDEHSGDWSIEEGDGK